jgi:ATP-dependent RNA helicase SUPV3L1/SUV3
MRTITEFFGPSLKAALEKLPTLNQEAAQAAQEAMKAEGKTDEEITVGLPAATKAALDAKIGETFKLEGDKLAMFAAALDVFKDARGAVKRILVQTKMTEEEKAPGTAKEIDGKFYSVENFVEAGRAAPQEERGGKFGDKRGGGRGKGGPGGDRGGRGAPRGDSPARSDAPRGEPRAPRAPRGDAGAPGFTAVTGESGRPARPARPAAEPYKGPNRIGGKAPAGDSAT